MLLKAALRRQQCSDVGKRSYDHFRIADQQGITPFGNASAFRVLTVGQSGIRLIESFNSILRLYGLLLTFQSVLDLGKKRPS